MLFDDFTYADQKAFIAHGWVIRAGKGWPGVADASWWKDGVSFVDDTARQGNRQLEMSSLTAGDGAGTRQTQICHQRKYLEGTYASRVRFSDTPASGPDGDAIVETFYSITPPNEPGYSEVDFEYLPNGGWDTDRPAIYVTTWVPRDPSAPKPPGPDADHDNTHDLAVGSLDGWHTLLAQVKNGMVSYHVDGRVIAVHRGRYYPHAPMSINYNLWLDPDRLLGSKEPRQYKERIDWLYFEADVALSLAQVEARVADLRRNGVEFQDTVPPWNPPLPSPCDL